MRVDCQRIERIDHLDFHRATRRSNSFRNLVESAQCPTREENAGPSCAKASAAAPPIAPPPP
jgi:hypothetical protein